MNKIIVRAAAIGDAGGIARVHVDTWRTAYRGIVSNAHLAAISYEKSEANWASAMKEGARICYIAQEGSGRIVGFACGGAIREPVPGYSGEIYAMYIVQPFQRHGIGQRLLAAAADELLRRGISSIVVWALAENPCKAFYEKLGGAPVAEKTIEIGGKSLREIAYGWTDIRTLTAAKKGNAMTEWCKTMDDRLWLPPERTKYSAEEAVFIRKALRLRRGQRVLDAPCGAGRIAFHLARAGCIVTGLDLRPQFIARAKAAFRREKLTARWVVSDLRSLSFSEEFDAIYNWFGSFGYFSDAEYADLVRRYARALRPGGRLLIDEPNRESVLRHFLPRMGDDSNYNVDHWDGRTQRCISKWYINGKLDPKNVSSMRFYTPAQMRALFERAGLRVEAAFGGPGGDSYRRSSRRLIMVGVK